MIDVVVIAIATVIVIMLLSSLRLPNATSFQLNINPGLVKILPKKSGEISVGM